MKLNLRNVTEPAKNHSMHSLVQYRPLNLNKPCELMVKDKIRTEEKVEHFEKFTSVIILPRVLFLSRWLAFFSSCCKTRSLVVLYSRENSETIRQNSFGLVSWTRCSGIPSQRMNLWKRLMIRRWTILKTIMRSAQSVKKSDILRSHGQL